MILTTDDIFYYDGEVPTKIVTSGIRLGRFKENPVMVFNHNLDNVLGTWENIQVEGNSITAIPNFDEDQYSTDMKNKYIKGTLKTSSIGIDVYNAEIDKDGVLVITDSEIFETSLATVPQNAKAKTNLSRKIKSGLKPENILGKRTDKFNSTSQITLTFSKDLEEKEDIKSIINKLNLMKEETEGTIKEVSTETEESNGVDIEAPLNTELKEELDESKKNIEEKDKTIEELSKKIEELSNSFKDLTKNMEDKEVELEASRKDFNDLKTTLDKYISNEKNSLLNESIALGRLTEEGAESLKDKELDELKQILSAIPENKNVDVVSKINLSRKNDQKIEQKEKKSYEWHLKNKKLGDLFNEDPEKYYELQQEFVKSKNEYI